MVTRKHLSTACCPRSTDVLRCRPARCVPGDNQCGGTSTSPIVTDPQSEVRGPCYEAEQSFDIPLVGFLYGQDVNVDAISLSGLAPVAGESGFLAELRIVSDADATNGAYVNR